MRLPTLFWKVFFSKDHALHPLLSLSNQGSRKNAAIKWFCSTFWRGGLDRETLKRLGSTYFESLHFAVSKTLLEMLKTFQWSKTQHSSIVWRSNRKSCFSMWQQLRRVKNSAESVLAAQYFSTMLPTDSKYVRVHTDAQWRFCLFLLIWTVRLVLEFESLRADLDKRILATP